MNRRSRYKRQSTVSDLKGITSFQVRIIIKIMIETTANTYRALATCIHLTLSNYYGPQFRETESEA